MIPSMPAKLTALATALGEPVVSAGNRPIQLDDPQSVWFVERGALDVFLLDNIIGIGTDLTIHDAWRAARLAALDKDIRAMPMGMFTPVSDGSATFSGGQIQRIRIAAALVRNPRIVFLDEATSWLDTQSQEAVMQGIGRLAVTRIVVAHRLSTIRTADRIYVLEEGRVVQKLIRWTAPGGALYLELTIPETLEEFNESAFATETGTRVVMSPDGMHWQFHDPGGVHQMISPGVEFFNDLIAPHFAAVDSSAVIRSIRQFIARNKKPD